MSQVVQSRIWADVIGQPIGTEKAYCPPGRRTGMGSCTFCEIAAGERDAHLLYETEHAVAFLDKNPAVRGHTLVAPKGHHEYLLRGDPSTATAVVETVQQVAEGLDRALHPDGVSVFYTSADIAGQITHAHVHLLPRDVDDDVRIALPRTKLDHDEAAQLTARVREHL